MGSQQDISMKWPMIIVMKTDMNMVVVLRVVILMNMIISEDQDYKGQDQDQNQDQDLSHHLTHFSLAPWVLEPKVTVV